MTFPQTFRFRLTVQWALVISGLLVLFSLAVYVGLWQILHRNLDATLWCIAASSLAAVSETADGGLHIHAAEFDVLQPQGLAHLDTLVRYRTFPQGQLLYKARYLEALELPLSASTRARLVQDGMVFETVQPPDAPRLRLVSLLCRKGGDVEYILQVGVSLAPTQATLASLCWLLLGLDTSALVLTAVGGAFLARRALRPVDRLVQAVECIESQHLHQRLIPICPADEMGRLTVVLNRLLERLERSFHSQQRFIADASHELRSPLTNLRLALEIALRRHRRPQAYRQALLHALADVGRLVRLINGLRTLAQADSGRLEMTRETVLLPRLLQRVVAEYQAQIQAKGIMLTLVLPPVMVKGDSTLLHQLCANLLDNALRYTPEHGRIAIVGHTQNGSVCVSISDTGSGIAPEHLPHVFERFYRADKARSQDGGGSGLGLAICWEIARAHGGGVRIESTVGQGCTCTVILPLEEHEPQ